MVFMSQGMRMLNVKDFSSRGAELPCGQADKAGKEFFLILEIAKWVIMRFLSMQFGEKSKSPSELEE